MVLVPLLLGGLIGLARGGRVAGLAAVRFRALGWLGAAVLAGAAIRIAPPALAPGALVASFALLVAFLWGNRRLPGLRWIAVGVVANGLAILTNGAMPVSASGAAALGGEVAAGGLRHEVATEGSLLTALGDIIPLAPLGAVVSVGDVVMAVGLCWFVAAGLLQTHGDETWGVMGWTRKRPRRR